jgi:hypothetical protein
MRQISNPARSNGVATAKIPKGAVASELANDGKKKTILRDLDNGFSSLNENDRYSAERSCHRNVSNLSGVCCNRRRRSDGCLWTPGGQLVAPCGGGGPGVWAPTGRERLEKCAHSAHSVVARGPEAADGWRGAAWAPGLRRRGGAFLAGKRGYCRWAGRWGPYIGWSRVLDPDCAHFHSRIAKNIFGVLAPGAGGGLRVRENALNEGHQACRTTKPIDEGFKAFSQLLWSGKSSEVWFSLRENHVNVGGFGLHQLRKCFSTRGTLFYCPPQVARGNFV